MPCGLPAPRVEDPDGGWGPGWEGGGEAAEENSLVDLPGLLPAQRLLLLLGKQGRGLRPSYRGDW